jgi:Restriction endonuclease NotI
LLAAAPFLLRLFGTARLLEIPFLNPMAQRARERYGAAELFGKDIAHLPSGELRRRASAPFGTETCPFIGRPCKKPGGVCSLRRYRLETNGVVSVAGAEVVATCPIRFRENEEIFKWIGETLVGSATPLIAREVKFLLASDGEANSEPDAVGRIDMVLVNPALDSLRWCAVEIQAVYFSGGKMGDDLAEMRAWTADTIPFPMRQRRPDFRSSGPKRLMPQLQIKVPTLRRWGKKMGVVVDRAFWESLGEMDNVGDVSNCDIAWFIVDWLGRGDRLVLTRYEVRYTTLEHAVVGLTGGRPVTQTEFESAIKQKLSVEN